MIIYILITSIFIVIYMALNSKNNLQGLFFTKIILNLYVALCVAWLDRDLAEALGFVLIIGFSISSFLLIKTKKHELDK